MNIREYYEKQRQLDENILQTKGLTRSGLITNKKVLAFKQEFGELLQRLPEVFKFWSNKKNITDYETVEEWVDGFHFLLSIGIDQGYDVLLVEVEAGRYLNYDLTDLALEIYEESIIDFDSYGTVFKKYMAFIYKLGYSDEDIKKAYDNKNAENFDRQARGY